MKRISMPSPVYNSKVAEANEDASNFRPNKAVKSQVLEKKLAAAPAAANNNTRLESKPSIDINESAELFIKKFRQQLLIQRLESIENYEQMLARGL